MSGYDIDRKIVFVTLAIGQEYLEKSLTLVQSVMKFTSSDIIIWTDCINECDGHKFYFGDRVKFMDITIYPQYTPRIGARFNYNLKGVALYLASKQTPQNLVYVDSDTFLFGWDKGISRFIHGYPETFMARFREKVSDNTSMPLHIPKKAEAYGIDYKTIDAHLAVETIMILTRGKLTDAFLDEWMKIIDYATINEIDPFIEAFELAMAIQNSNMNILMVNSTTPFADNFRTVHNGKIITTNII